MLAVCAGMRVEMEDMGCMLNAVCSGSSPIGRSGLATASKGRSAICRRRVLCLMSQIVQVTTKCDQIMAEDGDSGSQLLRSLAEERGYAE